MKKIFLATAPPCLGHVNGLGRNNVAGHGYLGYVQIGSATVA